LITPVGYWPLSGRFALGRSSKVIVCAPTCAWAAGVLGSRASPNADALSAAKSVSLRRRRSTWSPASANDSRPALPGGSLSVEKRLRNLRSPRRVLRETDAGAETRCQA
jgi:hypothetical protein